MMNNWIVETANKTANSWSAEMRDWATENGIVKGDEKGRMMWRKFITREELVTVLCRCLKENKSQVSDWSQTARNWSMKNSLILGDGSSFDWMENVTREQLVTILYRFFNIIGGKNNEEK